MTKEEFLSMIETELNKLGEKYKELTRTAEFYSAVNKDSKNYIAVKEQLQAVSEKIRVLSKLILLPSYERIQAMSDLELEQYRSNKIESISEKIADITNEIELKNSEIKKLEEDNEQLLKEYITLSESDKVAAANQIKKGQERVERIRELTKNIDELRAQITKLKKEQEAIELSPKEFFQKELLAQISENSKTIEEMLKEINDPDNLAISLIASAQDSEKANTLAGKLIQFNDVSNQQKDSKRGQTYGYTSLDFDGQSTFGDTVSEENKYFLHLLEYYLKDNSLLPEGHSHFYSLDYNSSSKLLEEIERYKEKIDSETKTIIDKLNQNKEEFQHLMERKNIQIRSINDISFLEKYISKLNSNSNFLYTELKKVIEERNNLSRKIFKNSKDKEMLAYKEGYIKKIYVELLMSAFQEFLNEMYKQEYGKSLLNYPNNREVFESTATLQGAIELIENQAEKAKTTIDKTIVKQITTQNEKVEDKAQEYEERKKQIFQEIVDLVGENVKDMDMTFLENSLNDDIIQQLSSGNIQSISYQREIVDQVRTEAQNQANQKEAELRKITVEELLEMKKELLENAPKKEDAASSMKR